MDENGDGIVRLDELRAQDKYMEERKALLDGTGAKEKEEYAVKNDNYIAYFDNDYDKIKADSDNDGKVSKVEYNKYVVYKEELKSAPPQYIKDDNVVQHSYRLDFSFYIVIGMLCITAIVIKLLQRK